MRPSVLAAATAVIACPRSVLASLLRVTKVVGGGAFDPVRDLGCSIVVSIRFGVAVLLREAPRSAARASPLRPPSERPSLPPARSERASPTLREFSKSSPPSSSSSTSSAAASSPTVSLSASASSSSQAPVALDAVRERIGRRRTSAANESAVSTTNEKGEMASDGSSVAPSHAVTRSKSNGEMRFATIISATTCRIVDSALSPRVTLNLTSRCKTLPPPAAAAAVALGGIG